jgi:hypothetical protein
VSEHAGLLQVRLTVVECVHARSASESVSTPDPDEGIRRIASAWQTPAVASFVITIDLPASPEASWAFVVDRGDEIEPLSFAPRGEQRVGALNDLSGRIVGTPIRAVSRTVEWDPPNACVFESVKPSWPIGTRITETFETSDAGTLHTIRYEVTPNGPLGALPALLVARLMRRSRMHYQRRLRDALARS